MNLHDEFEDIIEEPNYIGQHRAGRFPSTAKSQQVKTSDITKQDTMLYKIGAIAFALGLALFGASIWNQHHKSVSATDSADVASREQADAKASASATTAPSSAAPSISKSTPVTVFDVGASNGDAATTAAKKLTDAGYTTDSVGVYPDMDNPYAEGVYYTTPALKAPAEDIAKKLGLTATQTSDFPQDMTVVVS
ncbi:MAG: LytR C-terminal domain-containing protein [Micrococcaceae bacterium]